MSSLDDDPAAQAPGNPASPPGSAGPAGPEVVLPSDDDLSALEAEESDDDEEHTPFRPVVSILAAGGLGLIGAIAWAVITAVTDYELGLVAIALGALVGVGAAKGGRGQPAQIIGAVTAAVAFFFAKFLTVIFIIMFNPEVLAAADDAMILEAEEGAVVAGDASMGAPPVGQDVVVLDPSAPAVVVNEGPLPDEDPGLLGVLLAMFIFLVQDTFTSLSALFFGIAVWEGYRIPQRQ